MIGLSKETIKREAVAELEATIARAEQAVVWPPEAKAQWTRQRETLTELVKDRKRLEHLESLHRAAMLCGFAAFNSTGNAHLETTLRQAVDTDIAKRIGRQISQAHVEPDQPK